jgi:hypothetical protein
MKDSKVTKASKSLEKRNSKVLFVDIDVIEDNYENIKRVHNYTQKEGVKLIVLIGKRFYRDLGELSLKDLEQQVAELIANMELFILRYTGRSPRSFGGGDFIDCYFSVTEEQDLTVSSELIIGRKDEDFSGSFLTREHNINITKDSIIISEHGNDFPILAKDLEIKEIIIDEAV